MDVATSLLILLVTWPFWIVLAILIKLESRGSVFSQAGAGWPRMARCS
jgi:lipopolysaccharide/colanic/teichoic acid biosynthesis glycosyltransferase